MVETAETVGMTGMTGIGCDLQDEGATIQGCKTLTLPLMRFVPPPGLPWAAIRTRCPSKGTVFGQMVAALAVVAVCPTMGLPTGPASLLLHLARPARVTSVAPRCRPTSFKSLMAASTLSLLTKCTEAADPDLRSDEIGTDRAPPLDVAPPHLGHGETPSDVGRLAWNDVTTATTPDIEDRLHRATLCQPLPWHRETHHDDPLLGQSRLGGMTAPFLSHQTPLDLVPDHPTSCRRVTEAPCALL
jgi:hypothetical protein